jgi:hypothetical protein
MFCGLDYDRFRFALRPAEGRFRKEHHHKQAAKNPQP